MGAEKEKHMAVKLIAIDLDGTLLNTHHQVSDYVANVLQQAKKNNIHIILASGRPYSGIQPYLQQLGLDKAGNYCISNNGSVIHDASNGNHLIDFLLGMDDYQKIYQQTEELALSLHALGDHKIFTANKVIGFYTTHEAYLSNTLIHYVPMDEMPKDLLFTKLMISSEENYLSSVIKKIPASYFQQYTLVRSTPYFLEVLNKNANKGLAIQALAQQLDLYKHEIMCIGDQNNDLPMFDAAGICVAMENATEELKSRATYITSCNDSDGVAKAIEQYAL
ncbi:sugar-phosphatase [Providencia sp. R33]|nr:sugar-phosphatase [Providencia sp. R33]